MLQDGGQVRLPLHTDSSQMTAEPEGASSVADGSGGGRSGGTPAGVSPTGFILESSSGPASESSTRWVLASRTSTRSTSTANARRTRQHELIRDVKAPIGAAHGAWAREHRRREPSDFVAGIDPRHIVAGVSRSPRLRLGYHAKSKQYHCNQY